jgi:prephenate dehydratase
MKIGYYGIIGAYSYVSALRLFPKDELLGFVSPDIIIENVLCGDTDLGVIPIENSIAGRVDQTHNALLKYKDIKITGEYILPIKHCLIGKKSQNISSIKSVYSHPQAMMQCSKFIDKHNIKTFISDTADGVKHVSLSNDESIAGIASEECAKIYDCEVLAKDINNEFNNFTKFIIVSKETDIPLYQERKSYTTVLIIKLKNQIGSLADVLNVLKNCSVNIISIESYIPGAISSVSADFFVKLDGHVSSANIKQAMHEIDLINVSISIVNLGTYENFSLISQ